MCSEEIQSKSEHGKKISTTWTTWWRLIVFIITWWILLSWVFDETIIYRPPYLSLWMQRAQKNRNINYNRWTLTESLLLYLSFFIISSSWFWLSSFGSVSHQIVKLLRFAQHNFNLKCQEKGINYPHKQKWTGYEPTLSVKKESIWNPP